MATVIPFVFSLEHTPSSIPSNSGSSLSGAAIATKNTTANKKPSNFHSINNLVSAPSSSPQPTHLGPFTQYNAFIGSCDSMEVDQDVLMGAYLMSHLRHYCENCGTTETPQWRKGWHSDALGRSVLLCNACGLKFHKSQYCIYCFYVYGKEADKQSNLWLDCSVCGRWTHSQCESTFRQGKHEKSQLSSHHNQYRYSCPDCKNKPAPSTTLNDFINNNNSNTTNNSNITTAGKLPQHQQQIPFPSPISTVNASASNANATSGSIPSSPSASPSSLASCGQAANVSMHYEPMLGEKRSFPTTSSISTVTMSNGKSTQAPSMVFQSPLKTIQNGNVVAPMPTAVHQTD